MWLSAKKLNKLFSAPAKALMAMPANNMVETEVPVSVAAKRYTMLVAMMAPTKAPMATADTPNHSWEPNQPAPITIIKLAPAEAPLDTPIKEGSAKGLRNNPCIITPETANAAPTRAASNARGKRICCTII